MLVETARTGTRSRAAKPWRRRRVWLGLAVGVVFVLGGLAVPFAVYPEKARELYFQAGDLWPGLKEMAGLGAFSGKRSVLKAYFREPSRIVDRLASLPGAILRESSLPTLVLDIKFKHLRKLYKKRAAALQRGRLVRGSNDYVPAEIRFNGKTYRVKVRLKGDLTDHYNTEKWSLRVQVKGGGQVFGMRRFSLQAPKTRQYHGQLLYLDFLRKAGVLAPRFYFVNMWVNGTNIGLMALEEHFSKELLESQGRRESVILAFDETLHWSQFAEWAAPGVELVGNQKHESFFYDYTNAAVKPFQSGRVAKSKRLQANYRLGAGLLRGFIDGKLRASDVFDTELLGRYLAWVQLWGARHDFYWYNQRFYFNPITARLEPVAFDASFSYWDIRDDELIEAPHAFPLRLLADRKVFDSYYRALMQFTEQVLNGHLLTDLAKAEKVEWRNLAGEFPLLEHFPLKFLEKRARALRARSKEALRLAPDNLEARANAKFRANRPLFPPFIQLVHAYLLDEGKSTVLELRNAMPDDVEVRSISWVTRDGARRIPFKTSAPLSYPLRLPAKALDIAAEPRLVPFTRPDLDQPLRLMLETRRISDGEIVWSEAIPSVPVLSARPIPDGAVSEALSRHPFLRWDAATRRLVVRQGDWLVTGDLVVPAGAGLEIPKGTRLRFGPGKALIAHGPLYFKGEEGAPVILEGASGRWEGVAVLQAPALSRWRHVQLRGMSGVARGDWALTGAVTFFQSPVEMKSVRLSGNSCEDALNIVSSRFDLIDLNVEDTASDALDTDFSSGRVVGGLFRNIGGHSGGDGIDISGSTVSIEGVRFDGVSDKALSIGEESRAEARNVWIRNAGTGAASKDGSSLILSDSTIEGARVAGLMAYQKKPVYGGARLEARAVTITGNAPAALAQTGSRITVDDVSITAQDLDVQKLYKTVMRKAGS